LVYKAFALFWVVVIVTGPWGTPTGFKHNPTLVSSNTGVPIARTFCEGLDHCTVIQGEGEAGVGGVITKGQPTIVNVSVITSRNFDSAFTFVFDGIGFTWPPWGHIIVAKLSRILGIILQLISREIPFMETEAAVILILFGDFVRVIPSASSLIRLLPPFDDISVP